ncbi:MAG: hypothetical protein V4591_01720 [Bdellovibrionota bacterium]
MILTEIQADIIKELFNRGVGKAAVILSEMLSSQIILSVPQLVQGTSHDISDGLTETEIMGIKQKFDGVYHGEAMLLYGHRSCLEFIGSLLGYQEIPGEFGYFERETLSEFGNIILSSCLCEFENALGCKLSTSTPLVVSGQFPKDFLFAENFSSQDLLSLNMNFSLSNTSFTGKISLVLNPNDLKDMALRLDAYLERILAA